jgi:osmoprotectant transport system substrate-binding protein
VWLEQLGRADPPGDPSASVEAVRAADRLQGIVWLEPVFGEGLEQPPANATFAFFVAGPPAIDADLRTLSQLALRLSEQPDLSICVDPVFGQRPDGLAALLSTYSVRRDRPFLAAVPAQAVLGVLSGDCVAGLSHATDGVAWRAGLLPLADDLRFLPAFIPVPTVRAALLVERPTVRAALAPLPTVLSTAALGRANARVAAGESVESVARDLAGLLQATAASASPVR